MPENIMPLPTATQGNAARPPADPTVIVNPDARQSPFKAAFTAVLKADQPDATGDPVKDDAAKTEAIKKAEDTAQANADNVLQSRQQSKPSDAPSDDVPASLSPEGKADWKKLKSELAAIRTERDALKTDWDGKLKSEREAAAAALKAEYESKLRDFDNLRTEHEKLSGEFKRVAVEATPEWKTRFVEPIKSAVEQAKKIVGSEKGTQLAMLLEMPESEYRTNALESLVGELSPMRQQQVAALAMRVSEVQAARDAARADHGKYAEEHAAQSQRAQEAQAAKQKEDGERFYRRTLDWATKTLPVFQEREGNEAVNKLVGENREKLRNLLLGQNDPEALGQTAAWALYGQYAGNMLSAAAAEMEKKDALIAKLQGAQPRQGTTSSAGGGGGAAEKPMTFLQAIKRETSGV
jgi:hypothetical protein